MKNSGEYVWFTFTLTDCKEFIRWLSVADVYIGFDGDKTFYIGIPTSYFGVDLTSDAITTLLKELKKTYKEIALAGGLNIDRRLSLVDLAKPLDEIKQVEDRSIIFGEVVNNHNPLDKLMSLMYKPKKQKTEQPTQASQKPKEMDIARNLIIRSEASFVRQDKSLFRYRKGYWREMTVTHIDTLKNHVMDVCGGTLKSRDIDSIYKTFFRALPHVPEGVNLFDPHPYCVNFTNGTLHVRQSPECNYSLEFLPHNRDDFINSQFPYEYMGDDDSKNTMFLEMLDRVFKGDDDSEEKKRSVQQLFGACLIPAFPHLFFLYGKPGTGKSTVMQLASKMMSEENICSVEPSQFHGFNMESMIGKLVNIETDVTTNMPIDDAQIKKIVDRRKMRVRRKGIADAYGMLPAIHLFGGNAIPPTLEGALGAHDRRWSFIEFNNPQTSGLYNKEFHHEVFNHSPRGILNFALGGLKDLLGQRGHYINPASGKKKMFGWQLDSDPIGLFLEDIKNGDVNHADQNKLVDLHLDPSGRIERVTLFDRFAKWSINYGYQRCPLNRNKFFEGMRQKGFVDIKSNSKRYLSGISIGF